MRIKKYKLKNNARNFCRPRRCHNNVSLPICKLDENVCCKKDKRVVYFTKKKIIEQRKVQID
jgi:hypothetical protein